MVRLSLPTRRHSPLHPACIPPSLPLVRAPFPARTPGCGFGGPACSLVGPQPGSLVSSSLVDAGAAAGHRRSILARNHGPDCVCGPAPLPRLRLGVSTMAEDIKTKIKNYKTAPFDSRFPNQNQTRNCWQNYLDFHRCEKAMTAKGGDVSVCEWYRRVYKSLCPISWVSAWDERRAEGTFPGKI